MVAELLAEGWAIGNKALREYMEDRGYANAADWVYRHGFDPLVRSGDVLLSVTEARRVHKLALNLVWDVSPHPHPHPHPNATDNEDPGSFREHDVEAFPEGMRPPLWVDVSAQISTWVDDADALPDLAPREVAEALAAASSRSTRSATAAVGPEGCSSTSSSPA